MIQNFILLYTFFTYLIFCLQKFISASTAKCAFQFSRSTGASLPSSKILKCAPMFIISQSIAPLCLNLSPFTLCTYIGWYFLFPAVTFATYCLTTIWGIPLHRQENSWWGGVEASTSLCLKGSKSSQLGKNLEVLSDYSSLGQHRWSHFLYYSRMQGIHPIIDIGVEQRHSLPCRSIPKTIILINWSVIWQVLWLICWCDVLPDIIFFEHSIVNFGFYEYTTYYAFKEFVI